MPMRHHYVSIHDFFQFRTTTVVEWLEEYENTTPQNLWGRVLRMRWIIR